VNEKSGTQKKKKEKEPGSNDWPLVTAVVLNFNSGEHAIEAIKSLINNGYENLEIICIDDNSQRDDSKQTLKAFHDVTNFGTLILNSENKGIPKNLNEALRLARGEFILAIGDDIVLKDKISDDVSCFLSGPKNLAVVHSIHQSMSFDSSTLYPNFSHSLAYPEIFNDNTEFEAVLRNGGGISAPTAFLRASHVRSVGGWDEEIPWEDKPMWLKLAKHGFVFRFRPRVTVFYRRNPNSVSSVFRPGDLLGQVRTYLPYSEYSQARKHLNRSVFVAALSGVRLNDLTEYNDVVRLYKTSRKPNPLVVFSANFGILKTLSRMYVLLGKVRHKR
jgi:alpha-1,3-rhamnosyltransferase